MKEFDGAQVEDVVLVDPGRDDHQRRLVDLLRGRQELDQLHQLGLEHDLARRGGDVLAELEGLLVGHADAALLHVGEQVVQALEQVLAAARQRLAQHLRVGEREIGRRQRIHVLAREERDLLLRFGRQPLDAGHRVLDMARGDQVGLLHVVEQEVRAPVVVLEAAVALGGRRDRGRLHAHHLHPARLPELHVVDHQVGGKRGQPSRIRKHLRIQVHVGLGDAQLVAGGGRHARGMVLLRELAEQLRRALGDLVQHARGLVRIGRRRLVVHVLLL